MKYIYVVLILVVLWRSEVYGEDNETGKDLEGMISEHYLLSILYTDIKINKLIIQIFELKAEVEELRKMIEGSNESVATWPTEPKSVELCQLCLDDHACNKGINAGGISMMCMGYSCKCGCQS